jgi:ElaA protein
MDIEWQWCDLAELPLERLYAVFAARSEVFVVEQTSLYQDLDGLDLAARHLVGWSGSNVAAYLRVLGPDTRFAERSIGRVLTTRAFRGTGVGRVLVAKAVEYLDERYPHEPVRIGAQSHLERLYGGFGFIVASPPYVEDGIPHVELVRRNP